jgi:hypothetical protein
MFLPDPNPLDSQDIPMTVAQHQAFDFATAQPHLSMADDVNHGSNQSGWSYIVDRLIDKPGQTFVSLAHGRPAHLNARSIEALCYTLTKLGVLEKSGKGGSALFRVAKFGLERIPANWRHEGLPGAGFGERGQAKGKGPAAVARLAPEDRAPLSPLKGRPVELPDSAPTPRPSDLGAIELKAGGASPEALQAAQKARAEAAYTEATIILIQGGQPRRYPISVAKEMHRQLKEIFG